MGTSVSSGHRAIVGVLLAASIVAGACSSRSSGYASSCPAGVLPRCAIAPGAANCDRSDFACGLDSLPAGLSCSSPAQCSMPVFPCPDWQRYGEVQRTDGYVCSCIDGRWSCDDCSMGASLCAEAPDGARLIPNGFGVGDDDASYPSIPADAHPPVACQQIEGDAAVVFFAFTGSEVEAGFDDGIVEWFDDAGARESCGPSSCGTPCPTGTACSVAFILHDMVLSGTCL